MVILEEMLPFSTPTTFFFRYLIIFQSLLGLVGFDPRTTVGVLVYPCPLVLLCPIAPPGASSLKTQKTYLTRELVIRLRSLREDLRREHYI